MNRKIKQILLIIGIICSISIIANIYLTVKVTKFKNSNEGKAYTMYERLREDSIQKAKLIQAIGKANGDSAKIAKILNNSKTTNK